VDGRGLDNLLDEDGVVHANTRPHAIFKRAVCGVFWHDVIDANVTCIECIAREGENNRLIVPWDGATTPVIS